jgi:excisionase family DNA binding protein
MEKLLLTPEEAAEALGVGRSRVNDLMRTRQLPSVRIGKSRRVTVAAVHAYVERLAAGDALTPARERRGPDTDALT